MGTCSQGQNIQNVKGNERTLTKLVGYFYSIPMQQHPDIDSLIITKLERQKIISRGLSKNLIEEIVQFLNSRMIRNNEQDNLLDHFNYVYNQSFKKMNDFNTNLGKMILITTIEVLLCFKSLEMGELTPIDVWWVEDHFLWRYCQLQDQYKVDYDDFLDFNHLIKFLYLLKECIRIELKKMNFELKQLISSIKTEHQLQQQEIPNTARTVDTFRPQQKRLDTF
ncbi:unnamed protein product [Paramecium primaurelia]|uniref:Uncharacterized protein n=1 Tax=Paramecium primaurelia TaxID=5886 RepID=A0A8S1PBS7_PARPR|nr:unnamed protein product [Paramecium primaurelia]